MNLSQIYTGLFDGSLVPRYHTGVGMIQLYLTDTIRLHVFHPELPAKLEAFGNRHNHRFDLVSTVLLGAIVDIQLTPYHYVAGKFKLYGVTPAHLYTGQEVPVLAEAANYAVEMSGIRKITEGHSYSMSAGEYHETRAEGLTVTLMEKSNQVDIHARIIGHLGQKVGHAMEEKPSPAWLISLFTSALDHLSIAACKLIESETSK